MNPNIICVKLLICDSKIFSHCFKTHAEVILCAILFWPSSNLGCCDWEKTLLKSIFLIPSKFEEVLVIYNGIIPKSLGETILSFLDSQLDQVLKLS